MEDRDELLAHYEAMRADLVAAIAGLDAQAMTAPVIDGWSVVDHLAHLAFWDELRASDVERISAGSRPRGGWRRARTTSSAASSTNAAGRSRPSRRCGSWTGHARGWWPLFAALPAPLSNRIGTARPGCVRSTRRSTRPGFAPGEVVPTRGKGLIGDSHSVITTGAAVFASPALA